jgi:iron(III) transport system ATP-binding protein
MAELRIEGLSKAFGDVAILRGLSLAVASHRMVAVLGASGSGKTTLLRLICGFDRADAGTIAIGGRLVCGPGLHLRPEQRHVGYVAQEGALFPHLPVAGNITFGLPWRKRRARHRVAELLDIVGLPASYATRLPHELSGGEQQRVALARALAPAPPLVLLDEPFSALDAALRVETRQAVAAALAASGATAVLVTHDQSEALSMGHEVAVLRAGVVVQVATPRTLYRQPADLALARFLGEAVLVPGIVLGDAVQCALGVLPVVSACADGPVQVMIRPEQVRLSTSGDGHPAVVRAVAFYGHDCSVTLTGVGLPGRFTALVPGHATPGLGECVGVRVEGAVMAYPVDCAWVALGTK